LGGCGKSPPPTMVRFPDRPASNELLYRLSYPDPRLQLINNNSYLNCMYDMYDVF